MTATKLNSTGAGTVATGQSYTFAAGAAATPSINFLTATTTGLYLGSSAVGVSVGGVSVGTWSATALTAMAFISQADGALFARSGASTNAQYFQIANTGGGYYMGVESSTGGSLITGTAAYALILAAPTSRSVQLVANGALVSTFSSIGQALVGDLSVSNGLYRVTSNVTYSANTTLADITGLSATLTAGATYYFRAKLLGSGAAVPSAGGIKVAISGTCTATSIIASISGSFGTSATGPFYRTVVSALNSAASNTPTGDTSLDMQVEGTIVVNGAGTLTIQAAQVTASGVTTVGAGSTLWLQRLS